jgi:hypothetical protein
VLCAQETGSTARPPLINIRRSGAKGHRPSSRAVVCAAHHSTRDIRRSARQPSNHCDLSTPDRKNDLDALPPASRDHLESPRTFSGARVSGLRCRISRYRYQGGRATLIHSRRPRAMLWLEAPLACAGRSRWTGACSWLAHPLRLDYPASARTRQGRSLRLRRRRDGLPVTLDRTRPRAAGHGSQQRKGWLRSVRGCGISSPAND